MTNLSIVFLDNSSINYLRERWDVEDSYNFEPSLAVIEDSTRKHKNGVALLTDGKSIVGASRLTRKRRADDIRTKVNLSKIVLTEIPTSLALIQTRLLSGQLAPTIFPGGTFTNKATQIVQQWILDKHPEFTPTFDPATEPYPIHESGRLARIAEQRDATSALFAFARLIPDEIMDPADKEVLDDRCTFLSPLLATPREDVLIEHDVTRFLSWQPKPTDTVGIRSFTDGCGKTLHVMNANRTPAETTLGTDLIYYHVERKSFVLIQYKRMKKESKDWVYHPDEQLQKQLEAMRTIDDACANGLTTREFRLFQSPSWIKICKLENLTLSDTSLVPGMYLAREQVEDHLKAAESNPDTKKLFSFDNAPNYLTNTLFTDLVSQGLIGTSGSATDFVQQQIESSLINTGSTVVGILSDTSGNRPNRARPARTLHHDRQTARTDNHEAQCYPVVRHDHPSNARVF